MTIHRLFWTFLPCPPVETTAYMSKTDECLFPFQHALLEMLQLCHQERNLIPSIWIWVGLWFIYNLQDGQKRFLRLLSIADKRCTTSPVLAGKLAFGALNCHMRKLRYIERPCVGVPAVCPHQLHAIKGTCLLITPGRRHQVILVFKSSQLSLYSIGPIHWETETNLPL